MNPVNNNLVPVYLISNVDGQGVRNLVPNCYLDPQTSMLYELKGNDLVIKTCTPQWKGKGKDKVKDDAHRMYDVCTIVHPIIRENKQVNVHQLIAHTLLGMPPGQYSDFHVDHINTIRWDNRIENLQWLPANLNTQHGKITDLRRELQEILGRRGRKPHVDLKKLRQVIMFEAMHGPARHFEQTYGHPCRLFSQLFVDWLPKSVRTRLA
jgi:hypothetical protein